MRNLKKPGAAMRSVKEEPVVIDLDNDDEDVLCREVNQCMIDTSVMFSEANPSNMQRLLRAAANEDDDWGTKIDHQYMMLLDSLSEDGNSYLRDNPLRAIRYEVDNGGYDKREFKAVTIKQRSREDGNTIRVTKKNVVSKPHVQASRKRTMREASFESKRRESPVTENSVDAVLITSHVKRTAQHNDVEAHEKGNSEVQMVPDEGYRCYLKSLVEKSKNSRTNPEKEIQVKCEEDTMSSSDSDIVEVGDRPFIDEEDSPFVPSKNYKVVDLEEESDDDDQRSSWFRKEITSILKKPYNEKEFLELKHEASVRRVLTRSWQLLDGKEVTYETAQKTHSYLQKYPKFKRMFKNSLREKDRHRALNLLRGFIFYLMKVARHDAFKPWLDRECLKITSF